MSQINQDIFLLMENQILTLINHTNRNVFLTGKAGTGKTTLLHKIIRTSYKNTIVVAPSGIAALNAGGVTIHSFFQLPFAAFLPTLSSPPIVSEHIRFENRITLRKHFKMHKKKQQIIQNLELLVIDEVSMLRADVLDAMDYILQSVRKNRLPFGGVQVLFIGDLLQLPPVVKQEEWEILKQYYSGMYFFQSKVVNGNPPLYIELDKIYRQSDANFINILNHLRDNQLTQDDLSLLDKYVQPNFNAETHSDYITLTTHNAKADAINSKEMEKLKTKAFHYEAHIAGDFPEYLYPIDRNITLKEGARVMFIKNDPSPDRLFFNGKMGTITALENDEIVVQLDGEGSINVERYEWENIRYKINENTKEIEEERLGTFTQYPLRLAWAITVHKSQGLTFEKATLDLKSVFSAGQAYVAFSRLRSLEGLVLLSSINSQGINNSEEVKRYASNKVSEKELSDEYHIGKKQFLESLLIDCFSWNKLLEQWVLHVSSYSGDIGNKNLYKSWAIEQLGKVRELATITEKFTKQLQNYFTSDNDFNYIASRFEKAFNYFSPLLENLWYEVLRIDAEITYHKKVKQFKEELKELDFSIAEIVKKLFKTEQIINLEVEHKPFNNTLITTTKLIELHSKISNKITEHLKTKHLFINENPTKKTDKTAKEKTSTYETTLQLWKESKDITTVANARTLTASTIYKHISKLIEEGKINIEEVLSQEAISELNHIFSQAEELSLQSAYDRSNEKYTWDELRLFKAHLLKNKKG